MLSAGAGVRAKHLQPYEDHVIGGGVFILEAAIDSVERAGAGWRVRTSGTHGWSRSFEVDDFIAATGFATPLGDLPALGVATFNQGRLPRISHFWESTSVPGIFFAGTITQADAGLRKYGGAGNSAAVGGFRHNARVLAAHLARRQGIDVPRPALRPQEVVPYLLSEGPRARPSCSTRRPTWPGLSASIRGRASQRRVSCPWLTSWTPPAPTLWPSWSGPTPMAPTTRRST